MLFLRKTPIRHTLWRGQERSSLCMSVSAPKPDDSKLSQSNQQRKERPKSVISKKYVSGKPINKSKPSTSHKSNVPTSSAKSCTSMPVASGTKHLGELQCFHIHACSGCSLKDGLQQPPQFLEAQDFFKERGVQELKLTSGPLHGWRCRAKLAVRGTPGRPLIGLYKRGSHKVVDIVPGCRIHHPRINQAAHLIKQLILQLKTAPFDEASGSGVLRYLQLTAVGSPESGFRAEEDIHGAGVQVVLVVNSCGDGDPGHIAAVHLAAALWAHGRTRSGESRPDTSRATTTARPLIHSIWINRHPTVDSNAVLGDGGWKLLHGEADVWQDFGGTRVCLGPGNGQK
ncbi:hypothetical protein CEUSTIGMA_g7027.t1 [Chlamydomonas eustigma]|uniref:Uncharacterized protein n=1 Tax=Chlamydomonas eustigma TaxID=1157962 RepID=A0A250X944_9CHLO|nr:hypothetical protein CEUSTIGMA_g7027.t1 [Chlamydomonas eustigma]|eukprot:GAX79586.1 hypothetical protein CEUSTIGMA_g7027.t1 [Chlamydomonas eustigma]